MSNKDSESKADGLNYTEIKGYILGDLKGGNPSKRSIRKKGFNRAIRRGESWAIYEQTVKNTLNSVVKQLYDDNI